MTMKAWFEAGYEDIIPNIPPDGKIARGHNLSRGKCPGRPNANGEWTGFAGWATHKTTLAECEHWDEHGCSVGLRSKNYPGVDIDVKHEPLAQEFGELAIRMLGYTMLRIGLHPKRLLLYRTDEPFSKMVLRFKVDDDTHQIEILADGQQYVVAGVHPVTMQPYYYEHVDSIDWADVPKITREQVVAYLDRVEELLKSYGYEISDSSRGTVGLVGRSEVDPVSLLASDITHLEEALHCIPNDDPHEISQKKLIEIAAAVKAATEDPKHYPETIRYKFSDKDVAKKHPEYNPEEDVGFALFADFCERFPGRRPGQCTRNSYKGFWDRMVPPYALGAEYIYDLASEYGFNKALTYADNLLPTLPDVEESVWTPFSHAWMAEEFIKDYGNVVRAVGEFDRFIIRSGPTWRMDDEGNPFVGDLIRKYVISKFSDIRRLVPDEEAQQIEKTVGTYSWQNSVMRFLLYKHLDLRVKTTDLDSNPDILNTSKGIYCLKTGELLPMTTGLPQDICLKMAGTVPDFEMPTPLWDKYIQQITNYDPEILEYLNTYFGYAMTGHTMEHCFFLIAGKGQNGKSTLLKIISGVLGDYAVTVPGSVFLQTSGKEHPTELMTFQGRRLVVASEFGQRSVWDLGRLKTLTGGDTISARRMHKDFVEFNPTHTIAIAANHKPKVEYVDEAIRRRTRLIPFDLELTKEQKDPDLPDKLKEEYPGILAWMIKGSIRWYANRLPEIPQKVVVATNEYFGEMDIIKMWLDDKCVLDPDSQTPCKTVFESWRLYTAELKETSGTNASFSESIKRFGICLHRATKGEDRGKRFYKGIRMVEGEMQEDSDRFFT